MKKILFIWLLSGLFISAATAQYDDVLPTGYEGDNFSLEGALDLFKNSRSLEQFERKLNTRDNWVNNLDLNFDGRTDYIRVEHRRQGDFHAIILQALVGSWEIQDVAVIEIEKVSRRDAVLQIIGDEDLYGEEVIVEAYDRNTLVRDRRYRSDYGYRTSYVNVWNWSPIQFIFGRNYVTYVSPFNHYYYPNWWSPWNRCGWDVFRPRIVHYHAYYRPVRIHRVVNVHRFYRPNRSYCNAVVNRSNKVRKKHGKRTIDRPRVERNKRDRNRGVANRVQTGDRKDIRKRDKGISTRNRTDVSRSDARGTARDRGVSTKSRKDVRRDSKYTSTRRSTSKEVSSRPYRGTSTTSKSTTSRSKSTYGNSGRKKSKTKTSRSKSYSSKSSNRPSTSRSKSASSSRKVSRPTSSRSSSKRSSKSTYKKPSRSSKANKASSSKRGSTSKRGKRNRA